LGQQRLLLNSDSHKRGKSPVLKSHADENCAGTCAAQLGSTQFCGGHRASVRACSRSRLGWGPEAVEFSDDHLPLLPDQISPAAACDIYTRERLAIKLRF